MLNDEVNNLQQVQNYRLTIEPKNDRFKYFDHNRLKWRMSGGGGRRPLEPNTLSFELLC